MNLLIILFEVKKLIQYIMNMLYTGLVREKQEKLFYNIEQEDHQNKLREEVC